jgi:hypothetical protein
MINIRRWKHTLINKDSGKSFVMDVNPGGWDSVEERIYRHEDYHGTLYEDEISLKYPKLSNDVGGYQFIVDAYEAKGVKADLYRKTELLNPYTNAYEEHSYNKFDFDVDTGWKRMDEYFEIKTVDSSDVNKLLTRDKIEYDLFKLISSDNIAVKAFSNAYREALYKQIDIYLDAETAGYFNNPFTDDTRQLTVTSNTGNGDIKYVNYKGFSVSNDMDDRLIVTDTNETAYLYENTLEEETTYLREFLVDYVSNINISIYSESSNYNIWLSLLVNIYDDEGALLTANIPLYNGSNSYFFKYTGGISPVTNLANITIRDTFDLENFDPVSGNLGFPMPPGYRADFRLKAQLRSYVANKVVAASFNFFTNQNYIRSFKFTERTAGRPDNTIKGMMVHEAITRQIQLMTSKTTSNVVYAPILGNVDSEFQTYTSSGFLSYNHLTNGYQLRQIVDKALNIPFRDLFQCLSSITPIGMWFDSKNDRFYIDSIEKFYKTSFFPFILTEISDLDITPAKDFYFNEIESGYPSFENEDFQGAKEINTKTSHQISIETSNKLDLRSPINASSISIELARRSNRDSVGSSTDTKYDSEIYITRVDDDYQTLQGDLQNLSGFSGLDKYYNLEKTPRQNLQRNMSLLYQAALFKDSNEITQFTSSEKDENISYRDQLTGNDVNEFDDIEQYDQQMTKPEFYEFTSLYNNSIRTEIKKDPHRVLRFVDANNITKYGYIWEINGSVEKGTAKYKLVRANENRLSI